MEEGDMVRFLFNGLRLSLGARSKIRIDQSMTGLHILQ